jgi:hypothetical protein
VNFEINERRSWQVTISQVNALDREVHNSRVLFNVPIILSEALDVENEQWGEPQDFVSFDCSSYFLHHKDLSVHTMSIINEKG